MEVLHTKLLGSCKYFLKCVTPKLSKEQKQQVLARVSAYNMSGFTVKMHGNVCQHYQSFIGRDYLFSKSAAEHFKGCSTNSVLT